MKTAVELAINKIKELQSNTEIGSFTKRAYAICMDVLEDFKEIEKQQIIDAYSEGDVNGIMNNETRAEQYYNETFKKK